MRSVSKVVPGGRTGTRTEPSGLLVVLEQGDDGAADGHGGAVEGVQGPVALGLLTRQPMRRAW
jgi:hypothetical protein